jgi:hypothetical protein
VTSSPMLHLGWFEGYRAQPFWAFFQCAARFEVGYDAGHAEGVAAAQPVISLIATLSTDGMFCSGLTSRISQRMRSCRCGGTCRTYRY